MSPLKTRHLELTVLAVVMAFLLALTLAVSSLIWREHEDALRNSAAQSSRFVGGAVAALNRTLLGIDVLLASLEESLALSEQHLDTLDTAQASAMLRSIVGRNLMLRRLALLDAQSHVLAASSFSTIPALPDDFFTRVSAPQVFDLKISAPVRENSNDEHVLFLARQLKLADGTRVVALAEVLVMQLNTIMVQGADISGLEVTLERSNGQLLAGMPAQDKLLGTLLQHALPQGLLDTQSRPARLTGQPALVSTQSILY
ncbi:MAG: diguanylate cyclase, partial [Comamonadaceae bacterium CG_4_9_14_0_8_um_filter_57_21]